MSLPVPLSGSYSEPTEELPEEETTEAEERVSVATAGQLMWWRFRKHRLAVISAVVLILFYLVVVIAPFLAYADPELSEAQRGLMPPQAVHLFQDGNLRPYVDAVKGARDPNTFKRVYVTDPSVHVPLKFFTHGYSYKILSVFKSDVHLLGLDGVPAEEGLFILGTDLNGRDMWSRLMMASQMSLTIGLAAVTISLVLGVVLGGISGYFGGMLDTFIQRVIEILRSIPTIPLWMGLAAALPRDWSVNRIYLAITIIISLLGWTELARVVRGRFLTLREEDFITAAELAGCGKMRIILRHMVPSFASHIIAATTLAIPAMIISETSLSFLGLGLRPPAISWGVLLEQAQNIQSLAISPWLLIPVIPVVLAVLAFNFVGDGLRDAADPYG